MSTENVEQPVKRKSVADMWREREQAMLEKQQQPPILKSASPARRSFRTFEEKKIEGASAATSGTDSVNSGAEGGASNIAGQASTARKPLSTKSKFAMMGQKHAARPKKLATYQQYQQTAKKDVPNSPDSANSDDLLDGAFDDAVAKQEGDTKPSEYSSLQVSDSASIPNDVHDKQANDNYDDTASNISGLSSPGSPARSSRNQRRSNAMPETPEHGNGEDESVGSETYNSGGSSHSAHSVHSTHSNESPSGLDAVSVAVSEGLDDIVDGFDRTAKAVVKEEFVEEADKEGSAFQDALGKMTLEDVANDIKAEATALFGVIDLGKYKTDLNESMTSASEKINSLFVKKEDSQGETADAGSTPAEEITSASEPEGETAERSAEAGDTLAEAIASAPELQGDTAEKSAETSDNTADNKVISVAERISMLFAKNEESLEEKRETAAATTENADATENAEAMPENNELSPPESESQIESGKMDNEAIVEPPTESAAETEEVTESAPVKTTDATAATDAVESAPEEAAPSEEGNINVAPDPPLEAPDSSDIFDPFASSDPSEFVDFAVFPDDAFSSNFAAPTPAPAPKPVETFPVEPVLPKKELSPQRKPVSSPSRRKSPAEQEEVAIEVEYLDDDSDDDQADV